MNNGPILSNSRDSLHTPLTIQRALRYFPLLLIFLIILSLNSSNVSAQTTEGTKESSFHPALIDHIPISEFTYGENLEIKAGVKVEIEWLGFFYRPQGMESFQVRTMEPVSERQYSYVLDTSILISATFEYYLAAQSKERLIFLPGQAPEEFFEVRGKIEEPLPQIPKERELPKEERLKLPWLISGSASIGYPLGEESATTSDEQTLADGNMRLSTSYKRRDSQLKFDCNVSYSTHPLEGEEDFNLTDFILSLSGKKHHLLVGDVSVNGSEFTISSLARRGAEYTFDNEKLYAHMFNISSQQEKGWGGLIPKPDLRFYGGSIGYSFLEGKLPLRAVYVAGRDDPSQGKNVAGSLLESGEGEVFSLIPELKLFQDRLRLIAEFAQSRYDDNLEDEEGKKEDRAWSVGTNLSYPTFELGGSHRYIGKDFSSVGNQFYSLFTNNRKGYEAWLKIPLSSIGLQLIYEDEQDNVDDDPTYLTSYYENERATLSWDISPATSLTLGYGQSKQETFSDESREVLFQDSLTKEASLGLTFLVSPRTSVNISLSESKLSSGTDSSGDSSTLTSNLGASLRLGRVLSLSPNLSYSTSRSEGGTIETKTYNSFLSAELAIIPERVSLSTTGSFTRGEGGSENTTTDSANISASLNWQLKWRILGLDTSILSLRWDSQQTKSAVSSDKSERFMLEFHSSF
jgi:hypothetical protein